MAWRGSVNCAIDRVSVTGVRPVVCRYVPFVFDLLSDVALAACSATPRDVLVLLLDGITLVLQRGESH